MPLPDAGAHTHGSFTDKLQRYWDHPYPYGLVAAVKAAVNGVVAAVDGARAAAGPPPSTEEEAYRYNMLRDRGIIGAFRAASAFTPAAPEVTGGLFARAFADAAHAGLSSLRAGVRSGAEGLAEPLRPLMAPNRLEQGGIQQAKVRAAPAKIPFNEPHVQSNVAPQWDPARPYAVQVSPPPDPPGLPSAATKDPHFRQLSRVLHAPGDFSGGTGYAGSDKSADKSGLSGDAQVDPAANPHHDPSPVPQGLDLRATRKNFGKRRKGGGGGRNGGGSGGGGSASSGDEDDECSERLADEQRECSDRKDIYAHPDYFHGCRERAIDRWRMCFSNGGRPHPAEPPKWQPPDEETWRNYDR